MEEMKFLVVRIVRVRVRNVVMRPRVAEMVVLWVVSEGDVRRRWRGRKIIVSVFLT
jgi:hypothetical protein